MTAVQRFRLVINSHRSTSRSIASSKLQQKLLMTHAQLVEKAVRWLRSYRCGVVLSEQACVSGEMPDAIGWKRAPFRAGRVQSYARRFSGRPRQAFSSEARARSRLRTFLPGPAGISSTAKNSPQAGDCSNSAAAESKRTRLRQRIFAAPPASATK